MKFRKLIRWYNRYISRSHNLIFYDYGCLYNKGNGAIVKNSNISINQNSSLCVSAKAIVNNVHFQVDKNSTVTILPGVHIENADICVWNHSSLILGTNSIVNGASFVVEKGNVCIGDENRVEAGMRVTVCDGAIEIMDHNVLSNTFWVRFGGRINIGSYNCINEGTNIRADESVSIGSYNMISYHCDIWDTNTHFRYSLEEKKINFVKNFPYIGNEHKKPTTNPVRIGDGVWLGKYACILKGTILNNQATVGTRTVISDTVIDTGKTVVSSKSRII